MMHVATALSMAALLQGGLFIRPETAAPTVTREAVAAEQQAQLDYLFEVAVAEQQRLDDVMAKLFRANADLCPTQRLRLGLEAGSIQDVPAQFRPSAASRLKATDRLTVLALPASGPAAQAGIKVGDEIVSLDGAPVSYGAKAAERWTKQAAATLARKPASIALDIRREGRPMTFQITPAAWCDYQVETDTLSTEPNAFADGKRIVVNRAIMKLASTESELALVVAHELAHNTRQHPQSAKKNANTAAMGGLMVDLLGAVAGVDTGGYFTSAAARRGAAVASPEFETEADYVGMYFLARAGYPMAGVETFWRKMAVEAPEAIFVRSSHPPTADRFVMIGAARTEIEAKRAARQALVPNEKAAPAPKANSSTRPRR